MNCPVCNNPCVKNGFQANGRQRYYCKACKLSCQQDYQNRACVPNMDLSITGLLKEGMGIRSIARYFQISPSTVINRIVKISKTIEKPPTSLGKVYEMDEMRTYIGKKKRLVWIVYALRKDTREVVDFRVGTRTNKTLRMVIETLKRSSAKAIYTDKLPRYRFLIPKAMHRTVHRGINHIERKNLTLRTHLKRLNRKTICYSKNRAMLSACLKIYFWG